jgi:2,3-bisphosphoglycerate-independent phosphoglycerate mutase
MGYKVIVCLGDGMSDEPIAALGNKTPLQVAHTPNMDAIAKRGQAGLIHTVLPGMSPGSDVANMGILGYDPRLYYTGRGPIEAASLGIVPGENEIVFRCNLVNILDGTMNSFTSGHIETADADALLAVLNQTFLGRGIRFYTGVSYRHIMVVDKAFLGLSCMAPHDITDKPVAAYWPRGDAAEGLLAIITEAREVLANAETNRVRQAAGKLAATDIWPWSQGALPSLPSFVSEFGVTGGIVTAVDLLRGLGCLSGLETPFVPGATGFLDTDYAGKVAAGLALLETGDFAYLHIEAPDECGHLGDYTKKIQAIEDFDRHVVGPVMAYMDTHPNVRVAVLPDHPTPCALKTHTSDPVPVAIAGAGISPDNAVAYDEFAVREGVLRFSVPWALLRHLFGV